MEFTNDKINNHYVVAATGRLDTDTAGEFLEQCDKWLQLGEINVVVDMSGIEYISSSGLRSVLISAKKLRAKGGNLVFCELRGMVEDVFKITGFASMFQIFATRELAVRDKINSSESLRDGELNRC